MNYPLEWQEAAYRLGLTVIAGGLIGWDRGEGGRAAGLRTTILVCLAASASMIQVNLLLGMRGHAADSFVMLDLMRLPLGVLSGIGFIGAGAILRREHLVTGVTTAATLWYVTVMGLCLGSGLIGLGLSLLAIGLLVLKAFKWLESCMKQERLVTLTLMLLAEGPDEAEICRSLRQEAFHVLSVASTSSRIGSQVQRRLVLRLKYRSPKTDEVRTPLSIQQLFQSPGVTRLTWTPEAF